MQSKLFIANWKMQKTLVESIEFCSKNIDYLKALSAQTNIELVICPTFLAIYPLSKLLEKTMIHIGAQNCSPHENGAYTGQVSAQSLKEAGCDYSIVGHSEQRQYNNVTNQDVGYAALNLCNQKIEPIICIGETKSEFEENQAQSIIKAQLDSVIALLKNTKQSITIAYEPIWSIGTGIVPERQYLSQIFSHIASILKNNHSGPWRIIYGGSVSSETINGFKDLPHISGYLIGGASLDFQKFEKIVSLGK